MHDETLHREFHDREKKKKKERKEGRKEEMRLIEAEESAVKEWMDG